MHRFYIAPERWHAEPLTLEGAEARHCCAVLRQREGDTVHLINGRGGEARAVVASAARSRVVLRTLERAESPPPAARLCLGQALPKARKMDWIVQKATEIGATSIAPLLAERSVVKLAAGEAAAKTGKWRQSAIEAAKQCGRAWLPEVHEPRPLAELLAAAEGAGELLLLATMLPAALPIPARLDEFRRARGRPPRRVLVLVGPEGDFTSGEVELALAAGCRPVSLGPQVLRAETAALYALSVLAEALLQRASAGGERDP